MFWTLGEEACLPDTPEAAREKLRRGLDLLTGGDVFLDRYHVPRPEWVWDRAANPRLEAVATLGAFLRRRGSDAAGVESWLAGYRREGPGVYTAGGAAILAGPEPGGSRLRFVSGGQDALESLEFVVFEFHEWLREHPELEVIWQEEPLR